MTYRVEKYDGATGEKVRDYGTNLSEKDVKAIIKGCERCESEDSDAYMTVFHESGNTHYYLCSFIGNEWGDRAFWVTIKELRDACDMTQKAFSEMLKIPKRTIEDWEAGRRKPPEYVLDLIAYKLSNEGLL